MSHRYYRNSIDLTRIARFGGPASHSWIQITARERVWQLSEQDKSSGIDKLGGDKASLLDEEINHNV